MSRHDFDQLMNDHYHALDADHAPHRLAERIETIPDTEPDPSITPLRWRQRVGRWLVRDDGDVHSAGVRGRSRPTKDGRSRLMINAAATATAIAAVALGVAIVSHSGNTPETAPSAEGGASVVVPDDWAFFSGELRFDGNMPAGLEPPTPYVENGLLVTYGPGREGQTFTATDARLTGTRTELEGTEFQVSVGGPALWTERSRIENADGAWMCVLTGVSVPGSEGSADPLRSGWCDGSGAYEGYRAFMTIEFLGGGFSRLGVTGFVSNADGSILPASDE